MITNWKIPVQSQELDEGPELLLKPGSAVLRLDSDGAWYEIRFHNVIGLRFASFETCTAEQVRAYDQIVVVPSSNWAEQTRREAHLDISSAQHFRLFLDDVGCYEILADSVEVPNIDQ